MTLSKALHALDSPGQTGRTPQPAVLTPRERLAQLSPHWMSDDFTQFAFLPDPGLG